MRAAPRRRLPARVYWTRRAAVLVTVLALAFAVGRLVVKHTGADTTTVAQKSSPVPSTAVSAPKGSGPAPTAGPTFATSATPTATPTVVATPTLVPPTSVPTGACSDDEVAVTPAVGDVTGGGDVALPLDLTTTTTRACTWKVSSAALVVAISRGSNRLWSSQDCPSAVPSQDVVVRPDGEQPTQVQVTWGGRRSTQGCAAGQAWLDPGHYTVTAASLGGEPAKAAFALVAPPQPTVTRTVKPKKQKTPAAPASTPPG